MKKITVITICVILMCVSFGGCDVANGTTQNTMDTIRVADKLSLSQPTPTDIDYSLERYNLIRRAYWVNGQREKANMLVCAVEKPLGYIVLFSGNSVVGKFVVDGKVSCLNSYLSPDSEYFEQGYGAYGSSYGHGNKWLADVDGSYGENDAGIFFFTPDGKYVEYTGDYLYTDIPIEIENPVITYVNK